MIQFAKRVGNFVCELVLFTPQIGEVNNGYKFNLNVLVFVSILS